MLEEGGDEGSGGFAHRGTDGFGQGFGQAVDRFVHGLRIEGHGFADQVVMRLLDLHAAPGDIITRTIAGPASRVRLR